MESMTGYGRACAEGAALRIVMELRGVNSKGLDLHVRLPAPLSRHELRCRELVRGRVGRGRVDLTASLEYLADQAVEFTLSEGVVRAAGAAAAKFRAEGLLDRGLTLSDAMALPDAVGVHLAPGAEAEAQSLLEKALAEALASFVETRKREGARLEAQFRGGGATIRAELERARGLMREQVAGAKGRLQQRLAQLGAAVDPGRLEQEAVLAAQRSDVAEEVTRLESHASALDGLLAGEDRELGRRLDHLVQEMQREVSTLLAKSVLLDLTRAGMAMRLAVEQMREQAANVA